MMLEDNEFIPDNPVTRMMPVFDDDKNEKCSYDSRADRTVGAFRKTFCKEPGMVVSTLFTDPMCETSVKDDEGNDMDRTYTKGACQPFEFRIPEEIRRRDGGNRPGGNNNEGGEGGNNDGGRNGGNRPGGNNGGGRRGRRLLAEEEGMTGNMGNRRDGLGNRPERMDEMEENDYSDFNDYFTRLGNRMGREAYILMEDNPDMFVNPCMDLEGRRPCKRNKSCSYVDDECMWDEDPMKEMMVYYKVEWDTETVDGEDTMDKFCAEDVMPTQISTVMDFEAYCEKLVGDRAKCTPAIGCKFKAGKVGKKNKPDTCTPNLKREKLKCKNIGKQMDADKREALCGGMFEGCTLKGNKCKGTMRFSQ